MSVPARQADPCPTRRPHGRPHPAVAAVRLAVRRSLAGLPDGSLVLAACSGGADSLALAAALAFEAPKAGLRAGAVTVDHGLQVGSDQQAGLAASALRAMGLQPVFQVKADVAARGAADSYRGPEAAAREARYAALEATAAMSGAIAVMLGHTMDDQAETVLLGLARGSGARSMAGMAPATRCYLRPLLGLRRAQTRTACAALGLQPWDDPQNADPAFARTRVREQILPLIEELLGPGVTEALARTADQLRADAEVLDDLVAGQAGGLLRNGPDLEVASVAELPTAIRTRLLRMAAIAAGAPAGSLTARHVNELDALVTGWHGQRWIDLPGGVRCQRRRGALRFTRQ
jgi:tRNA(Ile)-lysidine synthase